MLRSSYLAVGLLACAACSGAEPSVERSVDQTLPPGECSTGQRPTVDGECSPVGATECGDGFRPASDGWGCEAIVAKEACSGATRAELGSVECVPLDDCDAAFPPAGTAKVVSSTAELNAALSKVPKGATIALEAGTYAPLALERDVRLVGRCAAKVHIRGEGQRGVYVTGPAKVSLRSMTIEGFDGGIVAAYYDAKVDAEAIVLSNNTLAMMAGEGRIDVRNSAIEAADAVDQAAAMSVMRDGTIDASLVDMRNLGTIITGFEDGSSVTLRRSVARYDGPVRKADMVIAAGGSVVTVEDSLLATRAGNLFFATDALPGVNVRGEKLGGTIRAKRSELRQIGFLGERTLANASAGGHMEVEDSSVFFEASFAFMVGDEASSLVLRRSSVRVNTAASSSQHVMHVTFGAKAVVEDTAIVGARGAAITVGNDESRLEMDRSLVVGTRQGDRVDHGDGCVGIAVGRGELVMRDSALVDNEYFALALGDKSRATIERSVFDHTIASEVVGGGVAIAVMQGAELRMSSSLVRANVDTGVVALLGKGIITSTSFVGNGVAVHLDGTTYREATVAPEAAEENELVVVDPEFVDNGEVTREAPFWSVLVME